MSEFNHDEVPLESPLPIVRINVTAEEFSAFRQLPESRSDSRMVDVLAKFLNFKLGDSNTRYAICIVEKVDERLT